MESTTVSDGNLLQSIEVCVCLCVCARVRERERERREAGKEPGIRATVGNIATLAINVIVTPDS